MKKGDIIKHIKMGITSKLSESPGFNVIPVRWVIERFFGWLGNFRCFSKDYEINSKNSKQMIVIANIGMLLNRHYQQDGILRSCVTTAAN